MRARDLLRASVFDQHLVQQHHAGDADLVSDAGQPLPRLDLGWAEAVVAVAAVVDPFRQLDGTRTAFGDFPVSLKLAACGELTLVDVAAAVSR